MALQISTTYKDIADKLIDRYPVAFAHIQLDKVLFLENTEKNPKQYADIRLVKQPYNFITEYKYIITFYEPKMITLNDAQKIMVVFHELLHIHEDFQKLRKHDIEDFRVLVSKYGVNWDIDPNLPNILEEDDNDPIQNIQLNDDDDDEEPEIM